LRIDTDFDSYHILSFTPLEYLPTEKDIDKLSVFIYHSPFAPDAFVNPILITNSQITSNDLIGYHEYLRQTHAQEKYASIANDYYQSGNMLADKTKYVEAIDAYSKAIDLFPQFFEAIDNRAFCKMDLGLWYEAIDDFRASLQQNPNSVLAEFSIGECYFNLGEYPMAKQQFEKASKIDPTHEAPQNFLNKVNEILSK
ncbi:MAG: tetratricopeptide repeat protein, partial [Flavobacterium sp.]